ncbi:unnamed protein product (macronuclear) [Paramecium tetraurelia]|uniref:Serine/threonine-protein phosphatase n=1 Tax=Paramecium tetraurelia TaxID=5888 RepID=A0D515_PARTE|nr:uncharacterized protein GSPATT00013579001 [Paramecium tetraurelia]CAK78132.1 unnamed protein product [Paramecium tetraurelia]|eukprot:XP_001445529.1 hypothetical protein (macronuclear) [Paramecium tetraurelia strain d4-2]
MDIDKQLEILRNGRCISERDTHLICELAKEILIEEPNVVQVKTPAIVCGDVHGQFFDLLELFKCGGQLPEKRYVFNGDYVNRGHHSVETFQYLLCLKIMYPKEIILLRGNHESGAITQVYGLYDEVKRKFGNPYVWQYFCEVFDYLPLCALIDQKVFCVHGGLSPQINNIDQIRVIDRRTAKDHEGPMSDMLWSDPDQDLEGWFVNNRGAGYQFGRKAVDQFSHINGLILIARSHQLVMEGYKYEFNKKLVTVWSAPNYCYRCGNEGCILVLDENLEQSFQFFKESAEPTQMIIGSTVLPYFL